MHMHVELLPCPYRNTSRICREMKHVEALGDCCVNNPAIFAVYGIFLELWVTATKINCTVKYAYIAVLST